MKETGSFVSVRPSTWTKVLTVDDENLSVACRQTRDTKEVDVVLRQRHDRLVTVSPSAGRASPIRVSREVGLLHIIPRYRSRVGSLQKTHVQVVKFAIRIRIFQAPSANVQEEEKRTKTYRKHSCHDRE